MTKPDLKPCPFCGKKDIHFRPTYISKDLIVPPKIGCRYCNYYLEGEVGILPNQYEESEQLSDNILINWWNKRANEK